MRHPGLLLMNIQDDFFSEGRMPIPGVDAQFVKKLNQLRKWTVGGTTRSL
jgi:hypothetical protein